MKTLIVLLFGALFASCMSNNCVESDAVEIENLINSYFDAYENHDYELALSYCTEEFVLFENGMVWNNDSLIKAFKKYTEMFPGGALRWDLSDFTVQIDCKTAQARYYNSGEFSTADTLMEKQWLESATAVNINGVWKLEFLHSTDMK